jgi:hypothetical protein
MENDIDTPAASPQAGFVLPEQTELQAAAERFGERFVPAVRDFLETHREEVFAELARGVAGCSSKPDDRLFSNILSQAVEDNLHQGMWRAASAWLKENWVALGPIRRQAQQTWVADQEWLRQRSEALLGDETASASDKDFAEYFLKNPPDLTFESDE